MKKLLLMCILPLVLCLSTFGQNEKISQLPVGAPAQGADIFPIARSGANYSLSLTNIWSVDPFNFVAGGDLGGSATSQEVTGVLSHALPGLSTGYLNWTGSAWAFTTPSGSFTAAGDLSGTSTSQEVIGLLSHNLPSLTTGYLNWNGSAWVLSTISGGGFTAGGDLSGTGTSQNVIGIQTHALPSLVPGYLNWTGSAWSYNTPTGTVPAATDTGMIPVSEPTSGFPFATVYPRCVNSAVYGLADPCLNAAAAAASYPNDCIDVPVNGTQTCSVDPTGGWQTAGRTNENGFNGELDFFQVGGGAATLNFDVPWLPMNNNMVLNFHGINIQNDTLFRQNVQGNRCWIYGTPNTTGNFATCNNTLVGGTLTISAKVSGTTCAQVQFTSGQANAGAYQIHGGEWINHFYFPQPGNNGGFRVLEAGDSICGGISGDMGPTYNGTTGVESYYINAPDATSCSGSTCTQSGAYAPVIAAGTPLIFMGLRPYDLYGSGGTNPTITITTDSMTSGTATILTSNTHGMTNGDVIKFPNNMSNLAVLDGLSLPAFGVVSNTSFKVFNGSSTVTSAADTGTPTDYAQCVNLDSSSANTYNCDIFALRLLNVGKAFNFGFGGEIYDNSQAEENSIVDNREGRPIYAASMADYHAWQNTSQNNDAFHHGELYCDNNNSKNCAKGNGSDFGVWNVPIIQDDTWTHEPFDGFTSNSNNQAGVIFDNQKGYSTGVGVDAIHFQQGGHLCDICIGVQAPTAGVTIRKIEANGNNGPGPAVSILVGGSNTPPISGFAGWTTGGVSYGTIINPSGGANGPLFMLITQGGGTASGTSPVFSGCTGVNTQCTNGTDGLVWANAGNHYPNSGSVSSGGDVVNVTTDSNQNSRAPWLFNGTTNNTWSSQTVSGYTFNSKGPTEVTDDTSNPSLYGNGMTFGSSGQGVIDASGNFSTSGNFIGALGQFNFSKLIEQGSCLSGTLGAVALCALNTNMFEISVNNAGYNWTLDSAGDSTQAGIMNAASVTTGTPPTVCGTATACFGATEGATATTPTSGQGAIRFNSTDHSPKVTVNGVAEVNLLTTEQASGTSATLVPPNSVYVCSTTCTVTIPMPPVNGTTPNRFCVYNGDNVATVITLAALGSSGQYENTARTGYGTAGTGTFTSGGAVKDSVCIEGLSDGTGHHYITTDSNGTWTAH
jgi:hypothetical protein